MFFFEALFQKLNSIAKKKILNNCCNFFLINFKYFSQMMFFKEPCCLPLVSSLALAYFHDQ